MKPKSVATISIANMDVVQSLGDLDNGVRSLYEVVIFPSLVKELEDAISR